jgi:hypothetical protein
MGLTDLTTTKTPVTLRPSSANLYAKCPAAAHGENDRFTINWEGNAAKVGSALHMAAKALVLHQPIPHGEIQRLYTLDRSEQRDLQILIACVRKYCETQLHGGGWNQNLVTEQRMEGAYETEQAIYDLGGTMDVAGFSADMTNWGTVDWKTTRLENADYAPQQMIYLWLSKRWIMLNLPPKKWPTHYQYHIVFVRDWTEEVSEAYTAEQLDAWLGGFIDRLESWNGREYHPGGHCLYCPRQADCPAIYHMVMAMARALQHEGFEQTAEKADAETLVDFYVKANAVSTLIGNAKDLLKALTVGRGGEIPSSQGTLKTEYRPRYVIDALKAWPLCEANLSEEQIAAAVTLSKERLLDGIAENTAKGGKGKAKEAFWEALQDAEAVEKTDSLVLSLKKARVIETKFEE